MELAIAPNKRELKSLMSWQARERKHTRAGSLEETIGQFKLSHNGYAADTAYVPMLPEISASTAVSNVMTPEMEAHMRDAAEFNQRYANRGIEQVVENGHAGLFERVAGKVYDAAVHGLSYVVNLVPAPVRRALAPAILTMPLILAAMACDSGPKTAYADARINRNEMVGRYDSERGILNLTIPVDYVSNAKGPVQGIVIVYNNGKQVATSEPYTLNPGRGTDFIVQATVPLVAGNYTLDIVVEMLGVQDSDPNNNTAQVAVNATPTPKATEVPATPTATATATSVPPTATPSPTPTEVPTPALETIIYQKLLDNVPAIKEFDNDQIHRRVINLAVAQIRDEIYSNNLDSATVQIGGKTYDAWDYISKSIGFVLPKLKGTDLSKYSDMDLRQILLPPQLRTVDIKRLIAERGINYTVSGLEIAIKNVTPDDSLGGKSPQEWLMEIVMQDYNDRNSRGYSEAMRALLNKPGYGGGDGKTPVWANSYENWKLVIADMLSKGEDSPLFVNGWAVYRVGEQHADIFVPLVGRSMDPPLAAYPVWANYMGVSLDGKVYIHTEPAVKYNGLLIHLWMNPDLFQKDYTNPLVKPQITLKGPDGKNYSPFEFK